MIKNKQLIARKGEPIYGFELTYKENSKQAEKRVLAKVTLVRDRVLNKSVNLFTQVIHVLTIQSIVWININYIFSTKKFKQLNQILSIK